MTLKYLSNEELNKTLLSLVKTEREVLGEILLHIAEVDRRRLYLQMAYPSLFEYMTKYLGYSAGSAQRRIDAARLSFEVPEVVEALEKGELHLAQVGLLQKTLRQAEKELRQASEERSENGSSRKAPKISIKQKQELLESLKQKSFAESQILISQALEIEIKTASKVQYQANESVRLEITLSKDQWQKLTEMRELLSHSLPNGSWEEALEYIADKVIEQKRGKKVKSSEINSRINPKIPKLTLRKTPSLQRQILARDRCCQYQDPKTGRICKSRWRLEVDHIQPRWAQGTNQPENLRLLCANHNKELYRRQANISVQ